MREKTPLAPGDRLIDALLEPEASGTVTVDIATGAAQDAAGNPTAAAGQVLHHRGPDAGAGSAAGRRDRACSAVADR